uniref:Uncharacterized protein n=1 Tax=Plectus sambesii TaxID=2011161 RepID=A0A914VEZ3_9BILA
MQFLSVAICAVFLPIFGYLAAAAPPLTAEWLADCKLKLPTIIFVLNQRCTALNAIYENITAQAHLDMDGCKECINRFNSTSYCEKWNLVPQNEDVYKAGAVEIRKECCKGTAWFC